MTLARHVLTALLVALPLAGHASAQQYDAALAAKWEKIEVVHYEAIGVITGKHVHIPPGDVDLYADVTDRVHLSFDWNRKTKTFVGKPKFANLPGTVANIMGIGGGCPVGEIKGSYEHYDIVEIVQPAPEEVVELKGIRVHPDTIVAEACHGKAFHKGGTEKLESEYIDPPEPGTLAFGAMLPPDSPLKVSKDGKSIIMDGGDGHFFWTYTPTAK
jgi:hypothetical protein